MRPGAAAAAAVVAVDKSDCKTDDDDDDDDDDGDTRPSLEALRRHNEGFDGSRDSDPSLLVSINT